MTTRHYRSEDGIVGYQAGDMLVNDDTGERSIVVRDGRGLALQPLQPQGDGDGDGDGDGNEGDM